MAKFHLAFKNISTSILCYDVTTLQLRNTMDADPGLEHSLCVSCRCAAVHLTPLAYSSHTSLPQVMWTDLPCQNFHLLVCCAILDSEKQKIMEEKYGFNEILKVRFVCMQHPQPSPLSILVFSKTLEC